MRRFSSNTKAEKWHSVALWLAGLPSHLCTNCIFPTLASRAQKEVQFSSAYSSNELYGQAAPRRQKRCLQMWRMQQLCVFSKRSFIALSAKSEMLRVGWKLLSPFTGLFLLPTPQSFCNGPDQIILHWPKLSQMVSLLCIMKGSSKTLLENLFL